MFLVDGLCTQIRAEFGRPEREASSPIEVDCSLLRVGIERFLKMQRDAGAMSKLK